MTLETVILADRALVRVTGEDAFGFLQGLITFDLELLEINDAGAGALLTPQGKVLTDFMVVRQVEGYLFDLPKETAPDFVKRLSMYKLRSKVTVLDVTQEYHVYAVLSGEHDNAVKDPRHKRLGQRIYRPISDEPLDGAVLSPDDYSARIDDYSGRLIESGVPQSPVDFKTGEVFPHDINLDQMGGIGFEKGCFVGQEVVSRVKHRGTARKRFVKVSALENLPAAGTDIEVDGRVIGILGRTIGNKGLAQVRIDRVGAALNAHEEITAHGISLTLEIPQGSSFVWG